MNVKGKAKQIKAKQNQLLMKEKGPQKTMQVSTNLVIKTEARKMGTRRTSLRWVTAVTQRSVIN